MVLAPPLTDDDILLSRTAAQSKGVQLGRAIGTLLRRRRLDDGELVFARESERLNAARDALASGLVLSGIRIVDAGIINWPRAQTFVDDVGGRGMIFLVDAGENAGVTVTVGERFGAALIHDVMEILSTGNFAVGEGGLRTVAPWERDKGRRPTSWTTVSPARHRVVDDTEDPLVPAHLDENTSLD